MKTLNIKLLMILLVSLGFIPSCSKDEKKVSPYIGNYVLDEALVAEAFNVPVTGLGDIPVAVGVPITAGVQTALLSAVSCTSADKTYVELRKNFSLYMSCEGANPLNAGTWTEVSATELLLNLNSTAVPTAPTGIVLSVSDVALNSGILTGITSVPLPKIMIQAILTAINPALILDPSAPDIFVIKISLSFIKK
jgi:hypothetical protein